MRHLGREDALTAFSNSPSPSVKDRQPLVRSDATVGLKLVQPRGGRSHLIVNISVEPRLATFETGPACHQVDMACLMLLRIAVPQPARVHGYGREGWMPGRRRQYCAALQL